MIRATTGPKKPVSRLTKTERWARTDQVFSSLGLMPVVVVMPGPGLPDPLGSGSTPRSLCSSSTATPLDLSPRLCTNKYATSARTFQGPSVTVPPILQRPRRADAIRLCRFGEVEFKRESHHGMFARCPRIMTLWSGADHPVGEGKK